MSRRSLSASGAVLRSGRSDAGERASICARKIRPNLLICSPSEEIYQGCGCYHIHLSRMLLHVIYDVGHQLHCLTPQAYVLPISELIK